MSRRRGRNTSARAEQDNNSFTFPPGVKLTPAPRGDGEQPCAVVMVQESLKPKPMYDIMARTVVRGTPNLTVPSGDGLLRPVAAPPADVDNVVGTHNGLAVAVRIAYNYHIPLRLRPDHLWITILNSFGIFVNINTEVLRTAFVSHEGKKTLCVSIPQCWEHSDALIQWDEVLDGVRALIYADAKEGVADAFQPSFTTSDSVSRTASSVALMAAMQSFYTFEMEAICGIRQVCLEGTLEDWETLRRRVARLGDFPGVSELIGYWFEKLDDVLLKFVQTYKGEPDVEWWSHIYSEYMVNGCVETGPYISGWFLSFFLYDRNKNLLHVKRSFGSGQAFDMLEENLPPGFVSVPFHWRLSSGGNRWFVLFTGSWHATLLEDGSVMPWLQWAVCEFGLTPR